MRIKPKKLLDKKLKIKTPETQSSKKDNIILEKCEMARNVRTKNRRRMMAKNIEKKIFKIF